MCAFLAIFRSLDRVPGLSGRQPARRRRAPRAAGARSFPVSPRWIGSAVALGVLLADQAAKLAVLTTLAGSAEHSTPFAPFLDLALRWNRGISFSLFVQNSVAGRAALLGFTAAAVALLIWWLATCRSALAAAGLGAIIGGALGNALDRVIRGAVVDYLDLHILGWHLFVFNLADAAINIGVAVLVIDFLFRPADVSRREVSAPKKR
jgi:signal peptidase II